MIKHEHGKDTVESLCLKVDKEGGWPAGAASLVMQHTTERECYFSGGYPWDGMNTVVLTRDDYYWWKISAKKKEEIRNKIVSEIRRAIQ